MSLARSQEKARSKDRIFQGDLQFVDVAFSKTYLVVLVQEGSGHAQLKVRRII